MDDADEKNAAAHTQRSEFVLSTTISELILLLFFLLLLLFGWHYLSSQDREKVLVEKMEIATADKKKAEAIVRAIYALVGKEPTAEDAKVLIAIDKVQAMLADSEKKSKVAEGQAIALQEALRRLREEGAGIAGKSPKDFGDFADMLFCESQSTDLSLGKQQLDDANRRNGELRERLKVCGGKGAGDYVACWRSSIDNKIQYMFEAAITAEGVTVSQKWPAERDQEMMRFPSERALVGKTVGVQQFLEATTDSFRDSETKHCRHYIVISGKRSDMSPQMFTVYHRLQDHFYHLPNIR